MTYTEELALLRTQQEKRRARLATWKKHGKPVPGLVLDTVSISPRKYTPASEAEVAELETEIAEADIEIAEKETARQQKLSGAARPPEPAPQSRLHYRSPLKNAILGHLMRNRKATTLQVCRGLDASGGVELPQSWRKKPGDRSFADAYKIPSVRRHIHRLVNKVRTDMRENRLLARR